MSEAEKTETTTEPAQPEMTVDPELLGDDVQITPPPDQAHAKLVSQQAELEAKIAQLHQKLADVNKAKPSEVQTEQEEIDYARKINNIESEISGLRKLIEGEQAKVKQKEADAYVRTLYSDSARLLGHLNSQHKLTAGNTDFSKRVAGKIERAVMAQVRSALIENPMNHGPNALTVESVTAMWQAELKDQRDIVAAMPSRKANEVAEQAEINNSAGAEAGSGSSPTGKDRPRPHPTSDEWWTERTAHARASLRDRVAAKQNA